MNLFNRIKFAAAVFDKNPEVQKLYKSGQLKFASEIDQPAKRPDVETMEAINAFMKRNPVEKADGGRIPFKYAGPVTFEKLIKPKIYEGNRFSKKMPKGTFTMRLYEGLDENGEKIFNTYTGKKEKLKKIFDKKNKARVKQAQSEKAATVSYDKPYKVLQGENKGKYLINYGGGAESPRVTKYFDPEEYGSDKAAYNAANKELTDYKNRPDKYSKLKENFRKNVVQPEGFVTGQEMLEEARKKGINVSENRQASNFADNFGFPKKQSGGVIFYDISKLNDQKEVDKILKAQVKAGAGTDEAKEKFPVKTKSEIAQKRYENIEAKGGVKKGSPIAGKRALNVDMGHAGNIFSTNANELITLDKLTYTPSQINEILGQKGGVDDKIRAIEKSQKKIIEKFNDADAASYMDKNNIFYDKSKGNFKKQLLNKSDATLTRLVLQSGGYKTAKLSTGVDFGKSFLKNIPDPFGLFAGMTERDFVDFRRQYITDEGNLKSSLLNDESKKLKVNLANTEDFSKVLKSNLPKKELRNLVNLKIMEENRIKQLEAAGDVPDDEVRKIIQSIGCDPKASGGRVGYNQGETCLRKGVDAINNNKIKTQAQAKNFEKLLKTTRNITKYGIIPEALFVTGESLIRMGLGDNPKEALLRASEYLLPGDQTKIADRSMYTRLLNENAANILERVNTYRNAQNKLENIKQQKENASNLTKTSDLDYFTQTQKDVDKYYNPLIEKQKAEIEKFKRPSPEMIYANRMQDEATDIRTANSAITRLKKLSKDMAMDDDIYNIEQLQAPSFKIDATLFPDYKKAMSSDKARNELQFMSFPDEVIKEFAKENNMNADELLLTKDALKQIYSIDNAANVFGAEQVYGAQGYGGVPIDLDMSNLTEPTSTRYENFSPRFNTYNPMAGGGIAGLSGGDKSGPAPESGPQSQGLQGLMNRVKNR